MKTRNIFIIGLLACCMLSACRKQIMSFETDTFKLEVDANGNISSLLDKNTPDGIFTGRTTIAFAGYPCRRGI